MRQRERPTGVGLLAEGQRCCYCTRPGPCGLLGAACASWSAQQLGQDAILNKGNNGRRPPGPAAAAAAPPPSAAGGAMVARPACAALCLIQQRLPSSASRREGRERCSQQAGLNMHQPGGRGRTAGWLCRRADAAMPHASSHMHGSELRPMLCSSSSRFPLRVLSRRSCALGPGDRNRPLLGYPGLSKNL